MTAAAAGRYRVRPGTLCPGRVELGAEQAHHLRVRRVRVGDDIVVFDGAGLEAVARLEKLEAGAALVRVERVARASGESPLCVTLVQALPVKLPRMDAIVRQCTELGVARILPLLSERGRVPGGGSEALARRAERWRRVAETAAKQCGRGRIPEIECPAGLADLQLERLPAPRLLLDPGGVALAREHLEPAGEATILIGTEGGWAPAEKDGLEQLGALRVGLGPRVLRADTAGAAVLAVLQYLAGDLGTPSAPHAGPTSGS